jgi:hypothetical protein
MDTAPSARIQESDGEKQMIYHEGDEELEGMKEVRGSSESHAVFSMQGRHHLSEASIGAPATTIDLLLNSQLRVLLVLRGDNRS